ncbi:MAG: DNA repair protein RadA, partial [Eubacteriales bacterium]|nr:DNA repair protein RadA [Eubacteriales bacterium]
MAKSEYKFVCQECGYETSKWLGKCPSCGQWNTFVEEVTMKIAHAETSASGAINAVELDNVQTGNEERFITGIGELDRVLGGGAVKGSLVLIGGDPGIGKSTLILQMCNGITAGTCLYISGEESISQVKMRADRLGVKNGGILIASETNMTAVLNAARRIKPAVLVVDSIQTVFSDELVSAPGSVSQVREVTLQLLRLAKSEGITVVIAGHVTKEGSMAGPRVLEHMVDTVLYFEGERQLSYRILRAVKNRFGSTNEIGIFEMTENGLEEVENPSAMLLSGRTEKESGSVVVCSMEGTRPMLIEIQALLIETSYNMPRRMTTGIDYNRIALLMAVLQKKTGLQLNNFDAYVNVVGGIRVNETAADLGVMTA